MTSQPTQGTPAQDTFKPDRAHILAACLLSGIALLGIGWMEWYWWWLFILPVLFIYWVLKSKTTVSEAGIDVTRAFRGTTHIPWNDFAGIEFQRTTYAVTQKGTKIALPGVTFNSLPRLAAASRGRIPDALTAGLNAADAKVRVVHRDGQEVLMTQEEYEAHLRENPQMRPEQQQSQEPNLDKNSDQK